MCTLTCIWGGSLSSFVTSAASLGFVPGWEWRKPQKANSLAHWQRQKQLATGAPGFQSPGQVALIISLITLETVNFSVCTWNCAIIALWVQREKLNQPLEKTGWAGPAATAASRRFLAALAAETRELRTEHKHDSLGCALLTNWKINLNSQRSAHF